MNEPNISDAGVGASRGRREGGWDLRVAFVEPRQIWWWTAWRATTGTELYGFAESRIAAWSAMSQAITTGRTPDQLGEQQCGRLPRAALRS